MLCAIGLSQGRVEGAAGEAGIIGFEVAEPLHHGFVDLQGIVADLGEIDDPGTNERIGGVKAVSANNPAIAVMRVSSAFSTAVRTASERRRPVAHGGIESWLEPGGIEPGVEQGKNALVKACVSLTAARTAAVLVRSQWAMIASHRSSRSLKCQ